MATVEVVGTPLHILQGSAVTLSAQFTSDGVAADPGATTVGIVASDGSEVVAPLTATGGLTTAPRTYALATGTDDLDTLTVTWTTTNLGTLTTTHEVIGGFLFTVSEARAYNTGVGTPLSNATTYPAAVIEEARARITDEFEAIAGVSFVPRYRVDVLSGAGTVALSLPRFEITDIRSVEERASGGVVWTAYDADDLADLLPEAWGELRRETRGVFTTGRRNVRVGYEHGYATPPLDIKRVALAAAAYELVPGQVNSRAISVTDDAGMTTQLWTPGLSGRGTAIHPLPEVDRVLRLYRRDMPVIA